MQKSILQIAILLTLLTFANHLFAQKTSKPGNKKKATTTQKLPPNTRIFYIDAERGKCDKPCLLVKKQGQKEYELFYDNIEGFNYEPGNAYTIWVREEPKTPPIAIDESIYKYVYVKTISKKSTLPIASTTTTTDNLKPLSGMNYTSKTTLVVNEEKVPCEKSPNSTCLLVKKENSKTFEIFYQEINGFVFEPGYRQTIVVNEQHLANAMANDPGTVYTLEKVIKKEKIKDMTSSGRQVTLVINEEKGKCEGNADAKCLLIKKEGAKEFEVFYQNITGFVFEEGFRQTILVNERPVANPSEMQAEPIYRLISVIKKEKINNIIANIPPIDASVPMTPLDKKWFLKKMKETDTSSFQIDDKGVWIEFKSAESKFTGKAPCNTFFGGFKTDFISSFKASDPGVTRMYCNNMELETLFFKLLSAVNTYEIKDGKLSLLKDGKAMLIFE